MRTTPGRPHSHRAASAAHISRGPGDPGRQLHRNGALSLEQTRHRLTTRPHALWREASRGPGAADLPPPHGQGPLGVCAPDTLRSVAKHSPRLSRPPQGCELGGQDRLTGLGATHGPAQRGDRAHSE